MDLGRFFLPTLNPIGFGAADSIELVLAIALAVLALFARPWIEPYASNMAGRTGLSMLLLALLPIALRLALLPQFPIPTPAVSDDFSYLLLADTLRHLRLANPPHPFHPFFETFFVLQEPAYSSIFPLGQGLVLAIGWIIFGHPWAGVALSIGAFCALIYWMLRGWTTPAWAFAGGLLAVIEFGPLNQWMNSYWGGAVSATAGCLVFGAIPRLNSAARMRDAAILGLGLALQLLTRPYEFLFLLVSAILFCTPSLRKPTKLAPALIVLAPALMLMLLHNRQATGSFTTLPYSLSQYQYGVPTSFTTQPVPVPHRALTREQQLDYEIQSQVHGPGTDSPTEFMDRFLTRARFYRFFFLAPIYLALLFFLLALRRARFVGVLVCLLAFSLGANFYPYFYPHYIAAITCLFILVSVIALDRINSLTGQLGGRLILYLCAAHFIFWYGFYLSRSEPLLRALTPYETWDAINRGDPEGRIAITQRLAAAPGRQLVFVRYYPPHQFEEWVHNGADIDAAQIVWARDLGQEKNEMLIAHYRGRTIWLLEPDFHPPRLTQLK